MATSKNVDDGVIYKYFSFEFKINQHDAPYKVLYRVSLSDQSLEVFTVSDREWKTITGIMLSYEQEITEEEAFAYLLS